MNNVLYAFLLCMGVACVLSPLVFKVLRRMKTGQNILEYVDNHKDKQGTLSMGGLIFVIASIVSVVLFKNSKMLAVLVLVIMLSYSLLGFLDDFIKVRNKHNEGLKPYQKIIGQLGIAVIVSIFVYNFGMLGGSIIVPFVNISINIGFWIIPLVIIFYIAVTNSVNLTDGLDGLAGYVSLIVIITLGIISLIKYNVAINNVVVESIVNEYLNISILCFGLVGALSIFLLFNCYPAKIFMGDTGSLALGGFIASVSAFLQEYLLIAIIGMCFVISSISDIIQVGYYKLRHKRVFLMAPFHHHLERKGLKETKVVGIYIFITMTLCIITVFLYMHQVV